MYCPKCKCEYQPGFEVCSDCSTELVEKLLPDDSNYRKKISKKKYSFDTKAKYYLFSCI